MREQSSQSDIRTPRESLKDKILLIDGDIIVYRCGFAVEKTKYLVARGDTKGGVSEGREVENAKEAKALQEEFGGVVWSSKDYESVDNALQVTKTCIENIIGSNPYELLLSGNSNFRYRVAYTKPYKAGRADKPKHYKSIRDYLINVYEGKVTDGIEADDAIGIRSSELNESSCVVSTDKDLDQLPGWHFNWVDSHVYRITPREGSFNFYRQLLTGDPTDNVPGIEGIGPAKAERILEGAKNSGELYERVWAVYRDRHGSKAEAYLKEQQELLWILRKPRDE